VADYFWEAVNPHLVSGEYVSAPNRFSLITSNAPSVAISGELSFLHLDRASLSGLVTGIRFPRKRGTVMNIFVGNLSFKTTEEELQKEFEAFGEVDSVKIIMDQYTLKSRGFGFVEMGNRDHALAAIAGLNGKELAGQTLTVNEARPREARRGQGRERSGGGGGGYGGRGRSGGGYGSGGRSGGGGGRRPH